MQLGRAPVGPIEEAIEVLVEHVDGIVLEVTPVIFDEGVGGRCFDVTGKGVDSIELPSCQRSINGHELYRWYSLITSVLHVVSMLANVSI